MKTPPTSAGSQIVTMQSASPYESDSGETDTKQCKHSWLGGRWLQ